MSCQNVARFEKSENGSELLDLPPSEIRQLEKNVEWVVEIFENLLHLFDCEGKKGKCYISFGLASHRYSRRSFKGWNTRQKKWRINLLRSVYNPAVPIKRLKLKTFENVHKKILLKASDKYWSSINSKETYSPGHNTLELYSVLVQFRFTTSKTKLDI